MHAVIHVRSVRPHAHQTSGSTALVTERHLPIVSCAARVGRSAPAVCQQYVCVCVFSYMHACIHTRIHEFSNERLRAHYLVHPNHEIVHVQLHIHTYIHECTHTYMPQCIHTKTREESVYAHALGFYPCRDSPLACQVKS
jgi:hypothetical protein